ncbi:TetR/AcrR family transcriptional regulator [Pseudoalteromonas sp. P1-11]|uniref:TetR/AcrR family transcriptional regulator n=1 Tax=Pseudoalteromonas sp. P1-11 TaxID=1715254 RepID=UPI0006DD062B|nr:TetR/AcrR family transcriptional regulator [Pseudoalteromonas sp. P1-11]KPW01837.1 Bacterial regulatory protein, tetR family [Pseudoalteromonas sp. P1-11]
MKQSETRRGRPSKEKNILSAELIVSKAKCMMAGTGKVPSMRAISKELNVDPMALYYYFNNKNILLEGVAKSLMSEIYVPSGKLDWKQELKELSKSYLAILRKYDGLLKTLLSMSSNSPADVFISRFNLIVNPLKLRSDQEKAFLDLLVDYLHGFSMALACDSTGELTPDHADNSLGFLFKGVQVYRIS